MCDTSKWEVPTLPAISVGSSIGGVWCKKVAHDKVEWYILKDCLIVEIYIKDIETITYKYPLNLIVERKEAIIGEFGPYAVE